MSAVQDLTAASARMVEVAKRLEACMAIMKRGRVTPDEQREMDAVMVEHKAAKAELAKAQKALKAFR